MRGRRQEMSRIVELGERSIRNFFFEHPMATYAAALAYRVLFGLFPFVFILVVLVGALGIPDFFDRAMDQTRTQSYQQVPQRLEPMVEQGRGQVAPFRGGPRAVVRLCHRTHPHRGFQCRLPGSRDPPLVETVSALPGLRTPPGASGDRLRRADAGRTAVGGEHSGVGGSRRVLRTLVGVAALSRSPSPAGRGALRGLPFWSQRQAAPPVGSPWRGARCGAVGDLLGGIFFLPGQLRELRRHLREPWRCRRPALLPLRLRFCGAVRRRAQRRDLPSGYGQMSMKSTVVEPEERT